MIFFAQSMVMLKLGVALCKRILVHAAGVANPGVVGWSFEKDGVFNRIEVGATDRY